MQGLSSCCGSAHQYSSGLSTTVRCCSEVTPSRVGRRWWRCLRDALAAAGLGLYLAPYGVLPTDYECGIIEVRHWKPNGV